MENRMFGGRKIAIMVTVEGEESDVKAGQDYAVRSGALMACGCGECSMRFQPAYVVGQTVIPTKYCVMAN